MVDRGYLPCLRDGCDGAVSKVRSDAYFECGEAGCDANYDVSSLIELYTAEVVEAVFPDLGLDTRQRRRVDLGREVDIAALEGRVARGDTLRMF